MFIFISYWLLLIEKSCYFYASLLNIIFIAVIIIFIFHYFYRKATFCYFWIHAYSFPNKYCFYPIFPIFPSYLVLSCFLQTPPSPPPRRVT